MLPPKIHRPRVPALPPARQFTLTNGLRVVATHVEQAPILMAELIWNAGRPYERQKLVAGATNALLVEGTRQRNATELEAYFEQFGASLNVPDDFDTGNLSVGTIVKHADRILPVLAELVAEAEFSEAEFKRYVKRSRQQLRENLKDPDTLAYRFISEAAFGSNAPYGYNGIAPDYDALSLAAVREHYRRCFVVPNATLQLVGKLDDKLERLIDDTFGQLPPAGELATPTYFAEDAPPGLLQLRRRRAQQTMIRRGRRGFAITDPDYPGLCVLETILGGFYGSRLMRNIREEKGYTYGIDSDLDTYRFDGSFGIAADVANENVDAVRTEILTEMDKLRQELVSTAELDMVRAYLTGGLVMDVDGPLNVSARYRSAIIKDYDAAAHLLRLDETIRTISASEIRDLAQKYLRPELDWEVIVGGAAPMAGAREVGNVSYPLKSHA